MNPKPDLHTLRVQLADMLDLHPMMDWSPELINAVNGLLEIYVLELGLGNSPAPVLELVRR